jgi:hypothetical protein
MTSVPDRMTIDMEPVLMLCPVLKQGTSKIWRLPTAIYAKPFQAQHKKKQHCAVTNDTPERQNTDMGMFWLHNPRMRICNVFPTNLPEKVCVNFCCRGKECKKENGEACTFLHP